MILSDDQVKLFWREWPKSCAAQGWTRAKGMSSKDIDAKRKEFLLRCGFDSLTKVDRTDGFTRVKNELTLLQRPDLKAARETVDPELNAARVLRHHIAAEIIPCLELYTKVFAYTDEVFFNRAAAMRRLDLPALTSGQLRQVRFTLAARLNSLRRAAGDTIHDMKLKASVPCACAKCRATPLTFIAPLHGPAELIGNPF